MRQEIAREQVQAQLRRITGTGEQSSQAEEQTVSPKDLFKVEGGRVEVKRTQVDDSYESTSNWSGSGGKLNGSDADSGSGRKIGGSETDSGSGGKIDDSDSGSGSGQRVDVANNGPADDWGPVSSIDWDLVRRQNQQVSSSSGAAGSNAQGHQTGDRGAAGEGGATGGGGQPPDGNGTSANEQENHPRGMICYSCEQCRAKIFMQDR